MSLIEGIGDEVLQFFALVLATLLGIFAWRSTNISDLPQIRTVLILGRRSQRDTADQQHQNGSQPQPEAGGRGDGTSDEATSGETKDEGTAEESKNSESKLLPESEQEGERERSETESGTGEESTTTTGENNDPPSVESPDNIRIRLKYLNDEQKLVEGKLQELLGDFKKRNFRLEISRHQRVRLIFNGQVLQSDDRTLQGCGLYDNCVVHCLVHAQSNPNANGAQAHAHSTPPDWNLGGLLYALLSVIFGVAWFFRYHYSHLFNIITTGTLVGLTIMFAGSVIGLYMPDQEVT